jgi:translation initiation factor IF-2
MTKKEPKIRPPVVVIMGHIDCGKTTLLDKIRETRVAEGESGGITQHIGAYQVEKDGKKITFIDTPGHEAFCQMRSRGAKAADIAIVVVDACKGVQDQTKEVIDCVKEIEIPVIIALNKMDKTGANPIKAKGQLQEKGLIVEDLNGDIPCIEISAITGKGVDDLLDLISLVAEMEELKSDTESQAEGTIIESYTDNQRGALTTLILNKGVLSVGDIVATPSTIGKVKALENFKGERIKSIYPSDPALLLGLENAPKVGEKIKVYQDLDKAREKMNKEENKKIEKVQAEPGKEKLNLIIKTDVRGSMEAINDILKEIPQEKIAINILKLQAGEINENDIQMAKTSDAIVLGFRTKKTSTAKKLLSKEHIDVQVMNFKIIYELVETVRKLMEKRLAPETVRTNLAKLKVVATFWKKKNRQIVGARVSKGTAVRGLKIEVIRDKKVIDRGKMVNLQRKQKDIKRASSGERVGILYEGKEKIEKGDILVLYKTKKEKGSL